ncbi:5315_t:CDS:1 [Funneliformis caledonium]|uniref:5315_t:CDS:1 n=1 Tax=Funneliformis caledonium TaxID=1117310 RepID=A0A9N9F1F4_9GLOM|nr:5315_t:CDS:1 [Funneliformis caledonium]
MSPKQFTLIINLFIILLILSTSIDSNTLIERDNIDFTPCTGEFCCASLAKKIAEKNFAHVATIAIVNKSGYNITHLPVTLEDGRFVKHDDHENIDINCEPQTEPLVNDQTETFSSITSRVFGGVKGIAIFTINDGGSSTFALFWNVPTIGPPIYEIEGLPNERYYNETKYGLDNTLYQVTIHQYEHVKNAVVNVWFIIPPYFFPPFIILFVSRIITV